MTDDWGLYVSAAQRRRNAIRKLAEWRKSGYAAKPITIDGRRITRTFWGNAWSANLECYSDLSNRLPRGRTYVRNGSVLDLQVKGGCVTAIVNGSEFYDVTITIQSLVKARWEKIKQRCAGRIDSVVELLAGKIDKGVMDVVTRQGEGLFPGPKEIELDCSCPDHANMCKHVAAALYGVGARLDSEPGLLFTLRQVDPAELIAVAVKAPAVPAKPGRGRVLQSDDMAALFGIDLNMDEEPTTISTSEPQASKPAPAVKKTGAKKKASSRRAASAKKPGAKKKASSRRAASAKKPVAKKKASSRRAASAKKSVAKKKASSRREASAKKPGAKKKVASKRKASTEKASIKKRSVGAKTPTTGK